MGELTKRCMPTGLPNRSTYDVEPVAVAVGTVVPSPLTTAITSVVYCSTSWAVTISEPCTPCRTPEPTPPTLRVTTTSGELTKRSPVAAASIVPSGLTRHSAPTERHTASIASRRVIHW